MNADRLLYLDASAVVKLVIAEPETGALIALLRDWPGRVTSALCRPEVLRAVGRAATAPEALARADRVLARLALVHVDDAVLERAGLLRPWTLRTLDAIHLATALSLGKDLGALVAYDTRFSAAARAAGIAVLAPT